MSILIKLRRPAGWTLILLAALLAASCGGEKPETGHFPADCLHQTFPGSNAEKISDIRVYTGESLWEYIDGEAELYHKYNFENAATADYRAETIEIIADIYKFAGASNAYGLYKAVCPESPDSVAIGNQGFKSSNSLTFVKGEYVARLNAFVSGEQTGRALMNLAKGLEACLPDTNQAL